MLSKPMLSTFDLLQYSMTNGSQVEVRHRQTEATFSVLQCTWSQIKGSIKARISSKLHTQALKLAFRTDQQCDEKKTET